MSNIEFIIDKIDFNALLMGKVYKKVKEQEVEVKLLKEQMIKQNASLALTYKEIKKLRKIVDSFLKW